MEKYSTHLGTISEEQFDQALQRLGLGNFVKAEKITYGIIGQNVFLTSTKGEFVFRGNPISPNQFLIEQFVASKLHKHTNVTVSYPYYVDELTDIFGWSYAIMPRLQGIQIANGGTMLMEIEKPDRLKIARAMAEVLVEMQKFTYKEHGEEASSLMNVYYADEDREEIIQGRQEHIAKLRERHPVTDEDADYIMNILTENIDGLFVPFEPCFKMGDFKEDNVLFSHDAKSGDWEVCGVYDLAYSHFGDGESEIYRAYAMYLEVDVDVAAEFISTYKALKPPREGFEKRLKVHLMGERLGMWEWAMNEQKAWWDENFSLKDWLMFYLER